MGILGGYVPRNGTASLEFAQCQGFKASVATSAYLSTGKELAVFGNDTGYVYEMENGNTLDGTLMYCVYQTPYYVMDDTNVRKAFYKLHMFVVPEGNYNFTSNLVLDYQNKDTIQPESEVVADFQSGAATYGTSGAVYGQAIYGGTLTPTAVDLS